MSLFGNLFGGGSNAASDYRQYALQGLQGGMDYLNQAKVPIQTAYQQGTAAWQPLQAPAQGGFNAYADITGAQGQAGQDRARALFQTDPGYQFAMDQALQATQRAQGTGGYQQSGNVLAALQDRASGLAQQQYNQYVQRLAPYLNVAPQIAGAQTGLAQWQGGNLANILGTQGNLWSNTANAIGQVQAGQDIANQQAGTSLLQGGLGLGAKLLGYGLGGPAGATAFGGLFGSK